MLHVRRNVRSKATGKAGSALPNRFGRYEIRRQLGEGGMGAVFLADDRELNRPVAIKVPFFGDGDAEEVVERFKREARAVAALHHPNICPVYDVGEHEGIHYMTMAYIEGQPLTHYLHRQKRPGVRAIAHLIRKIALALEEAHRHGVVHRDLKPANIMINQRGEPVIMDFGLARCEKLNDDALTRAGTVIGTPQYMAPEQISGKADSIGPSCDIYSLGVLLYVLLTRRLPHEGDNLLALLSEIATTNPAPPSQLREDGDASLDAICLKALAKLPEHRYPSARALADDLLEYLKRGPAARNKSAVANKQQSRPGNNPTVKAGNPAATSDRDFGSSVRFPILGDSSVHTVMKSRAKSSRSLIPSVLAGVGGIALLLTLATATLVSYWPSQASSPPVDDGTSPGAVAELPPDEPRLPSLNNASRDSQRPSDRETATGLVDLSKPAKVFIVAGQPSMAGRLTLPVLQQFAENAPNSGEFFHALRQQQNWATRDDVWIVATDTSGSSRRMGNLIVGFGETADEIGLEWSLGSALGDRFEEQVVIIRVSAPPIALGEEFLPPTAEATAGNAYQKLVEEVGHSLQAFKQSSGYHGQSLEIAGLFWIQGVSDSLNEQCRAEYADNLRNLFRDQRRQWNAPDMKFVVGEYCRSPQDAAAGESARNHAQWLRQTHQQVVQDPEFQGSINVVITMHDLDIRSPEETVNLFHASPGNLLNLGADYARAMLQL